MSKFLGPIHHWLFHKIKLHEDLEMELICAYKEKYGDEIESIAKKMENQYGSPIEDKPLDQLIDTENIHGWLQNRISIAETRQAAILTAIFNKHGQDAVKIALDLYRNQGAQSGLDAKAKGQTDSAPGIYKALNNYILDGMPCDNVNNISSADPDRVEWKNIKCLHRSYWEAVGADVEIFYRLRTAWIQAFVENANENFTYQVSKADFNGLPGFIHQIKTKLH